MNDSAPKDTSDKPPPNLDDIDDERMYSTVEAGQFLGLHQQTIISHIKRKNITAVLRKERRGYTYDISGREIKRFHRERKRPGPPRKTLSTTQSSETHDGSSE